jgi:hypothetical protein
MLASYYINPKITKIKVAEWGTPKKQKQKQKNKKIKNYFIQQGGKTSKQQKNDRRTEKN